MNLARNRLTCGPEDGQTWMCGRTSLFCDFDFLFFSVTYCQSFACFEARHAHSTNGRAS